MSVAVGDYVWDLIYQFNLHGTSEKPTTNVNLESLENLFPLVEEDMTALSIDGFVIPPPGNITADNPAIVTVNRTLGAYWKRIVYAHEIGHALHGHAGAFRMDQMDSWFIDREERDAWRIAAVLLVPMSAIAEHGETRRIASACNVPEWLVRLA